MVARRSLDRSAAAAGGASTTLALEGRRNADAAAARDLAPEVCQGPIGCDCKEAANCGSSHGGGVRLTQSGEASAQGRGSSPLVRVRRRRRYVFPIDASQQHDEARRASSVA
eukprot:6121126-Prymnesium_polylepis.1